MQKIDKNLRILRHLHDLSQENVADLIGISQKAYSRLENDEAALTIGIADKIAATYKMSKSELLKFLETDDRVFIQKIADINHGAFTANGSVVQHQGLNDKEREILFKQLEQQQAVINQLLQELSKLKKD